MADRKKVLARRKVVIVPYRNPVARRKEGFTVGASTLIVVVALAILIIWYVTKNKGEYKNLEEWEIVRNEQGFATKIVVHRDAKQS